MLEISKLGLATANACWKKEECVLMLSDLFIESQISFLQRLGIITPVFFFGRSWQNLLLNWVWIGKRPGNGMIFKFLNLLMQ
jgi:hypothetical protein